MKRILYSVFLLLVSLSLSAAPRTRQQALAIAQKLAGHISTIVSSDAVTEAQARLNVTESGTEAYYVFNNGSDNGYMIISGEDRLPALIGYTVNGDFDADNLPEQLKDFLSQYVALVDSVENDKITLADGVVGGDEGLLGANITPVGALLGNTMWNQSDPFNQQCPLIEGEHAVTGCGPTAVAQVMRYWKYPAALTTAIPAYGSYAAITLSETPSENAYDWDNMLGQYTSAATQNQIDAVAKLMNHVGHVMKASYGLSATGGTSTSYESIKSVFSFYGYDSSLLQELRKYNFSYTEWKTMITDEIKHSRPVVYGGQAGPYGHAFVLDGIDANGLYHVNWGWGGSCNGYFDVTILNPNDNTGIGASTSTDGYNGYAIMVVGITSKNDDGEETYSTSGTVPTTSTDKLSFTITDKDGGTTLYRNSKYNVYNKLQLTVTNPTDNEFDGQTDVVLSESSTTTATDYDVKYISVPANSTVTYDINCCIKSTSTATKYYVTAFGTQKEFAVSTVDDPVLTVTSITSSASENNLTPTDFVLSDSQTESLMLPTLKSDSITYTVTIQNTGGYYYGKDIVVGYYKVGTAGSFSGSYKTLEIPSGESKTFTFTNNSLTIDNYTGVYLWSGNSNVTLKKAVTQTLKYPNSDTAESFSGSYYAYVAGPSTNVNVTSANFASNDNAYYSSLYLDYAVQLPDGVSAYTAMIDKANSKVTLNKIGSGIVPANTGVILRMTDKQNYELTPTTTAETVPSDLQGVLEDTPVTKLSSGSTAYVLSIYDNSPAFQKYSGTYLRANKAYLILPSESARFNMNFMDDEATGIDAIHNPHSTISKTQCYNLQGQRVNADAKGIVIMNGKKIINK